MSRGRNVRETTFAGTGEALSVPHKLINWERI